MAGRGRTSFQKRQKEQLRLERRQQKAARKQERKTNKDTGIETPDDGIEAMDVSSEPEFTPSEELNPAGGLLRSGPDAAGPR
jgi:hypothetical protein